jgi:hypothetical protein
VTELLKTEPLEEKVKLCFVIGMSPVVSLVSIATDSLAVAVADEPRLAKMAAEQECHQEIITLLDTVEKADQAGTLSRDLASRGREVSKHPSSLADHREHSLPLPLWLSHSTAFASGSQSPNHRVYRIYYRVSHIHHLVFVRRHANSRELSAVPCRWSALA